MYVLFFFVDGRAVIKLKNLSFDLFAIYVWFIFILVLFIMQQTMLELTFRKDINSRVVDQREILKYYVMATVLEPNRNGSLSWYAAHNDASN